MDIYATRTLIQVNENIFPNRPFLTDTFSEEGDVFNTEEVEVQFRKGQRLVSPYVNPLLPGKVMERTGYSTKLYKPALIKPMRAITSVDITRASYGENIYSTKTPQQRADEILVRDMLDLNDYNARRKEVMLSEAIFEGRVTQIGDGVDQVLDFDLTNNITLPVDEQWDKANTNAFTQLQTWIQKVQRNSGRVIKRILMAQDAATAFIDNVAVQEYLDLRRGEFGTITPREEINGASFIGHFSFPGVDVDVWSFNEIYIENWNEDGTQKIVPEIKEIVPSGMIALIPDGPLFRWNYGAITLTNPSTNGFMTYAVPVVPQSWITIEPPQRFLQMLTRPIPIPVNVDSWLVAQVITPTAVSQVV